LTGGDAELPMPKDTIINWLMSAMVLHESEFDFAIQQHPLNALYNQFDVIVEGKGVYGLEASG
jgi:hypothetical protein